ncbi:hypothetical protein BDF22DRAFT_693750 [Syncephalis plumigaleata]|nr:hypothetical protein BDF22DRAFT_693750 [Syncephalis plumigaleata]
MLLKLVFTAFAFVAAIVAHPTSSIYDSGESDIVGRLARRDVEIPSPSWRSDFLSLGRGIATSDVPNGRLFVNKIAGALVNASTDYPLNAHIGIAFVPQYIPSVRWPRSVNQARYHMAVGISSLPDLPENGYAEITSVSGHLIHYSKKKGQRYINCSRIMEDFQNGAVTAYSIDRPIDIYNGEYNRALSGQCRY